jgi:hypothetical protein
MRLHNTQSDASYCTRSRGRSVTGGIAYLGNEDPTEINGRIVQLYRMLWHLSVKQNMLPQFIPHRWQQLVNEKPCLISVILSLPRTSLLTIRSLLE